MKFYETFLLSKGLEVEYIQSIDEASDIRKFSSVIKSHHISSITVYDPCDDWLIRRLSYLCRTSEVDLHIIRNPMFLNSKNEILEYFSGKKKLLQTDFYIKQRIKYNILIDHHQKPIGSQWSFDADNRKKFPKNQKAPDIIKFESDQWRKEADEYVEAYFKNNPGEADTFFCYAVTFDEAKKALKDFFENRLKDFGIYEDAIVQNESFLHHSILSPLINVGLITPLQIIEKTLDHANQHDIPLNSLEGFIRQVIGWREFIRGVYDMFGRQQRVKNFFGYTYEMPSSFYKGNTGIKPIDDAIKKLLKTGYNHHIERLMILGNFMLLCEIHPEHVYRWFMELYIDAYDWVMVPNIYGMSQFADGGLMCTKPYVSGSNYILKMSDYKKEPWSEIWDSLFWRFMDKNREFLKRNPRLNMLIHSFDKMPDDKKNILMDTAERFLHKIHHQKEKAS